MTFQYKAMCGCDFCITAKNLHSSLMTWCDRHMKHLKKIHNAQNSKSDELSSRFYETHKEVVKPHGCHIHCIASDMAMETMCPCT